MVNITGFGHANNRVNQQTRLNVSCGAKCQLLVRAMHRITRLKCDHLAPAKFLETVSHFARRIAQVFVIIVRRLFQAAQRAANVNRVTDVFQVIHSRVLCVRRDRCCEAAV